MNYHGYIDQSKRRPYRCGECGLDILHPVHQPQLAGLEFERESDERESEPVESKPYREDERQLALFGGAAAAENRGD